MHNFSITTFSPRDFVRATSQKIISYSYCETSAGKMIVWSNSYGIYKASFDLEEPLLHTATFAATIDYSKLVLIGTPFQLKVWQAALAITPGTIVSYQALAAAIGAPSSSRAVANALGQNKIPYFIPCHRIIRTDGSLGGYAWGLDKKVALLQAESSCSCPH